MRPLRRVATAVTKPQAVDPLSRVVDYPLLISWGYDPVTGIFAPDPDHPLLGYQVCRPEAWPGRTGRGTVAAWSAGSRASNVPWEQTICAWPVTG